MRPNWDTTPRLTACLMLTPLERGVGATRREFRRAVEGMIVAVDVGVGTGTDGKGPQVGRLIF